MEDAHTHILSVDGNDDVSFFAVYDGHGSAAVSQHAGEEMLPRIMDQKEYSMFPLILVLILLTGGARSSQLLLVLHVHGIVLHTCLLSA